MRDTDKRDTGSWRDVSIFVDFDGTISEKDVGEQMFLKFGDAREANNIFERWVKNEINSIESWQLLCKMIDHLDFEKFDTFLDSMKIDSTFHNFVDYIEKQNHSMLILSDGLDYYIRKILTREGLQRVPFISNILIAETGGEIFPAFPHTDEECDRCANCKRNHILDKTSDHQVTVYIGDGLSDTCPAQFCDIIFAKNSLLKYCEKERISYYPYKNFDDIIRIMEQLRRKKRIKRRHQAFLKRREFFLKG